MAKRQDFTAFTIRLDTELVNQITARGRLARRSRCAEVERLLEFAVGYEIEKEKRFPGVYFIDPADKSKS